MVASVDQGREAQLGASLRAGEAVAWQSEVTMQLEAGAGWLATFIVRHWLVVFNAMAFFFILPAFLAPYLAALGADLPAGVIYTLYRLTCHQLPERSFFISGHKVAICARCSGIYLAFWSMGLLYGLWSLLPFSRRCHWPPLSLRVLFILLLPMAIDGVTQLLGLRASTNLLRALTGALAGSGFGLFIYPTLEIGFSEVRERVTLKEVASRSPSA